MKTRFNRNSMDWLRFFARWSFLVALSVFLALSHSAKAMPRGEWLSSIETQKKAMTVLGSYALLNISTGLILRGQTEGSGRYFHEMNALWNSVNLAIAGFSLLSVQNKHEQNLTPHEMRSDYEFINRFLMLNMGLDVAYMTAGYFLMKDFQNQRDDKLLGYGRSLILQGAFLLVFDTLFYLDHVSILGSQSTKIALTPQQIQVTLRY